MTRRYDVAIVGSGPAGMAAAVETRRHNLDVVVIDEQATPGGRIWRSAENHRAEPPSGVASHDVRAGIAAIAEFRASGVDYLPSTRVWNLEPGWHISVSGEGASRIIEASSVILAIGAQERPVPFVGATLPGVMTVGAAQVLFKSSSQIPSEPVWIAGSGPLPLHYAHQLVDAGGQVAGFLDTTSARVVRRVLPHAAGAALGWRQLAQGAAAVTRLRRAGVARVREVATITALGDTHLEAIRFTTAGGRTRTVETSMLLVHEGIVPSIHVTLAAGCDHLWRDDQGCLAPVVDEWGMTSLEGLYVVGDASGIGGVDAASIQGRLGGLGVALRLGAVGNDEVRRRVAKGRRALSRRLRVRAFVEAYSQPRPEVMSPPDEAIVCRCEEVTAGTIRQVAAGGVAGVNQIKAATRAGMGACQGRQCGYPVMHLLAEVTDQKVEDLGFFNVRPPLTPVTIGELADLHERRA